ncbi:MAG: HNH endonuclease signature motif containing protein [Candidatus Tumulicola sp.]
MDKRRKYDWAAVQEYYNQGNTYDECIRKFGFSRGAWQKALVRGEIATRIRRWSIEEVVRSAKSRTHLKLRLLDAGLLEPRCYRCGINTWCGKPLSVQIDHINGIRYDNRLANLRMLCPNCHSLTPTYGYRKRTK